MACLRRPREMTSKGRRAHHLRDIVVASCWVVSNAVVLLSFLGLPPDSSGIGAAFSWVLLLAFGLFWVTETVVGHAARSGSWFRHVPVSHPGEIRGDERAGAASARENGRMNPSGSTARHIRRGFRFRAPTGPAPAHVAVDGMAHRRAGFCGES
jgi:hypothetical protein